MKKKIRVTKSLFSGRTNMYNLPTNTYKNGSKFNSIQCILVEFRPHQRPFKNPSCKQQFWQLSYFRVEPYPFQSSTSDLTCNKKKHNLNLCSLLFVMYFHFTFGIGAVLLIKFTGVTSLNLSWVKFAGVRSLNLLILGEVYRGYIT